MFVAGWRVARSEASLKSRFYALQCSRSDWYEQIE
jgi:hypothetical protein